MMTIMIKVEFRWPENELNICDIYTVMFANALANT